MLQEIIGGNQTGDSLPSNATEYSVLQGGHPFRAAESDVWQVVSAPGILTSFLVETDLPAGVGESFTFTIRVNGGSPAGGLVVTLNHPATQGLDRTNSIALNASDYIDIQCVGSAAAAAAVAGRWSCIFTGTNPGESLIMGGRWIVLNAAAARVSALMGGYHPWFAAGSESSAGQIIPTNGTIRNLYVRLSAAPGVNPDGYRFRLRVNGAFPAGTLDCTVTAPATTCSDLVNAVVVAPGDRVNIYVDPVNGPAVTPTGHWGFQFDPTIDGESVILGGTDNLLNNGAVEYGVVCGQRTNWNLNEIRRLQLTQAPPGGTCILRKFYVWLGAAPGAGTTWNFKIRRNMADSGIGVDIANLNQSGNDIVNTITLADYDDLGMQADPTVGAPANTHAHWGVVGYIAPATAAPVGGGTAAALIARRLI